MKPGWKITSLAVGLALVCSAAGLAYAGVLPQEPGDEYLVNEEVDVVVGFYIREYSTAGNGITDYRTARQILRSEFDESWNSVVQAVEFPLFYWYDENQDGHFEMWIDRKVEGCRCDIVPYVVEPQEE